MRRAATTLVGGLLVGALLLLAAPAWASVSVSPSAVRADVDVTLTLTASIDRAGFNQALSVSLPGGMEALGCGAPDGWTCSAAGVSASYERGASLNPTDMTFTLSVHTPTDPGLYTLRAIQTYNDGQSTASTPTVTVEAPEPSPTPTSEPTPESTEEPAPEPTTTPAIETHDDAPPPTPFRPPDDDDDSANGDDSGTVVRAPTEPDSRAVLTPRSQSSILPGPVVAVLVGLLAVCAAAIGVVLRNS